VPTAQHHATAADDLDRPAHRFSLTVEGKHLGCGVQWNPARFLHLEVVIGDVPAEVLEEEEMDELVKAYPLAAPIVADVPVFDDLERGDEPSVDAGFLAYFTNRGRFGCLAIVHDPFRQLPTSFGTDLYERHVAPRA